MKKSTIITIIIIVILLIALAMFWPSKDQQNSAEESVKDNKTSQPITQPEAKQAETAKTNNNGYQIQTKDQASVVVEITPKQLGINEEKNIFAITFNTHSVPLEFDFVKTIVLTDDLGNSYSALEWTGESGGHHLQGDIVFPKLDQAATSISLAINDINGAERVFDWDLQ